MHGVGQGPELLERERELYLLDESIGLTLKEGGVVVLGGPAGIGKTTLLGEARRRGAEQGMAVV